MNTYLLIEAYNNIGKVAYVETVNNQDNIVSWIVKDQSIITVTAYTKLKDAKKQADFLNDLYKIKKNKSFLY